MVIATAAEMEHHIAAELGFVRPHGRDRGVDLQSPSGTHVLQLKVSARQGMRDLRAGLLELATVLDDRPGVSGHFLWVVDTLPPSVEREWERIRSVLKDDVARRLALVVIATHGGDRSSFVSEMSRVAQTAVSVVQAERRPQGTAGSSSPREPKWISIARFLLARRLLRLGPIGRGELCAHVGCSLPTLSAALKRFGSSLRVGRARQVELTEFPTQLWQEVVTLSSLTRTTHAFVDRSGGRPDPEALFRRLSRMRPAHVAVGGVIAARHWDPSFDLNGTPRLDLTIHVDESERRGPDLDFVRRLDPALTLRSPQGPAPVLVMHELRRPTALFDHDTASGLPWADPAETLLDLWDLRLVEQGIAMVERLGSRH